MTEIEKELFELRDKEYAEFQAKLIPGIDRASVIGVRIPVLREYAKKLRKEKTEEEISYFLQELPHVYYDENLLHAVLISEIKEFDCCVEEVNRFLPYVDNWAVCDTMIPKVFKKHIEQLKETMLSWIKSPLVYTCRYGVGTLMRFFLDEHFEAELLMLPAGIQSEEYYVNMMLAWFYATALAKQWEAAIPYLEKNSLSVWVHNKTIQKACESFRVTDEHKKYLRTLKR